MPHYGLTRRGTAACAEARRMDADATGAPPSGYRTEVVNRFPKSRISCESQ